MTITEFLLARIAEDERRASSPDAAWSMHWPECDFPGDIPGSCTCNLTARVLAECEAKRRIVDECRSAAHWATQSDCDAPASYLMVAGVLEGAVRNLALPYADHPDYDPAWSLNG